MALRFGDGLAFLVWHLLPKFRRLADRMIHTAFGERYGREERSRIARRAYRNTVRALIDFMRFPVLSRDGLLDLCCGVEGWEHLEKALAASPGAVIGLAGHIGNWEYSGAYLPARGIPLTAVGREQRETAITNLIIGARSKVGIDHIPRSKQANRRLVASFKRKGGVVGLLSDQNGGRAGIFVPFFGKLASTVRGPAYFALRYRLPIVPVFAVWEGLKYKVIVLEPVEAVSHEDEEEAIRRTSANIQAVYEKIISAYPDQWLWVHDRWKTRPPGEHGAG
jgi:KDO2-lipid IV(A) lauroyltransferase